MNTINKIQESMTSRSLNRAGSSLWSLFIAMILICVGSQTLSAQDCSQRAVACNNRLNIPLNENCEAVITIDLILEDQVGDDSDYELRIFDPQGVRLNSNVLTEDFDCQPLNVEVECLSSGIFCWGTIVIEDKIAPSLSITPLDTAILCNIHDFQLDPNALVTEVIFSDQGSCAEPDSLGITDFVLTENETCSDTVATILRSFTVVDQSKFRNDTTVVQTIFLLRPSFSDFDLPQDTVIDCREAGDLSVEALGQPMLNSCDMFFDVAMEEDMFPTCGGSQKILRRWTIFDTCRDQDTVINQSIDIIDTSAAIIDFNLFDIPASILEANKEFCTASAIDLPNPIITDCSIIQPSQLRAFIQFADQSGLPFGPRFPASVNSMETMDLNDVPIGQDFVVIFEVVDSCGNFSSGSSDVFRAEDTTDPSAVCESSTIVSITSSGFTEVTAESLDDHSFDNCGVVRREIRRLNSTCSGFGSDMQFGESVSFCCEDVSNNPVQVLLRVFDANDNFSECIIDVVVQDKRQPIITCPSDATFACDVNLDDIDQLISDAGMPTVEWVCGVGVVTADIPEDIEVSTCGMGGFNIVWTATDPNGATAQCIQRITIEDNTPVTITPPPAEVSVTSCTEGISPDDIPNSQPVAIGADCENVAMSFEDNPATVTGNNPEFCQVIERTWTVIDWCQFENGGVDAATLGTFTQSIIIQDNDAPMFTSVPEDFEVNDDNGDCLAQVTFTVDATDACTNDENIEYAFSLDIDGDNVSDSDGMGATFSRLLGPGEYSVTYTATDQCGNAQTAEVSFEVSSSTLPIPILEATHIVNLQADGSVSLLASDLNISSSQGCNPEDATGLSFAFSADPNNSVRTFTCADIPNGVSGTQSVPVFVIDDAGNVNSVNVLITITDANFNACPDNTALVSISGAITDENNDAVANISVSAFDPSRNGSFEVTTDENGQYSISDLTMNGDYNVEANLEGFDLTGVTTLDLVLIQRHVLGLQALDSPYKLIAADINNSASVSAADLAELRKLILGTRSDLGQNNSWRFIDKNFVFPDPLRPWNYPTLAEISNISSNEDAVDFVGLKVGDVNGNAFGALAQAMAGVRSVGVWKMASTETDGQVVYTLTPPEEMVYGLQMSLDFAGSAADLASVEGLNISSDDYAIVDGKLNISWTNVDAQLIGADTPITITVNTRSFNQTPLSLSTTGIESEYYTNTFETKGIQFIEVADETSITLGQNVPNPFNRTTQIEFTLPTRENTLLQVTDLNGQMIYQTSDVFDAGTNTITIHASDIAGSGVYYYTLTTSTSKVTKRMVIIN